MEGPQVARLLKRDAFGRVELLTGERGAAVRRVAGGAPAVRLVARLLLGRERRALRRLAGLEGVPALLESDGWLAYRAAPSADGRAPRGADVLLRSWAEGVPLHEAQALPRDFFERLEDLVRELHALGVCHNDLHKEPNVLVLPDGRPHVVDFQLASLHPRAGRGFDVRAREDLRHVDKHRRRYQARGAEEPGGPPRSTTAELWRRWGKPLYNALTRRLLRRADGEPRRPRGGPWPRWTPALGPARAAGRPPAAGRTRG